MKFNFNKTKYLLDRAVEEYNQFEFIENDPIQIPHRFVQKEDVEIAAFLSAIIAWGNRKMILKNASRLMEILDNKPYNSLTDLYFFEEKSQEIQTFVHRTFNGDDCLYFFQSLENIYLHHGGLEKVFTDGYRQTNSIFGALYHFRNVFLELPHEKRVEKHLSNVMANSSAKRLNMFLRWMVRRDENGVDFGLWQDIPMSALMLPLDVHTGNISRQLGLLSRKQNNWKAVEEVMSNLRQFDANDPVKYDFALFGLGINGFLK